jgi:RNA polymerase sigma-70 factor (ECF subfamily)
MHRGDESAPARAWDDEGSLIDAIRQDAPDPVALQALVDRHWRMLYARCLVLTAHADDAQDLAQETWCRVLRARQSLRPDGSFAGYVVTVATNLWRDQLRSARRAGVLADGELVTLDAPVTLAGGDAVALADAIADPSTLDLASRAAAAIDVDRALGRLSPRARELLLARYVDGESAAELGRRFQRTEQTITAWLRQACDALRHALEAEHREGAERMLPPAVQREDKQSAAEAQARPLREDARAESARQAM